jgi:V8-like Glu-specific endopeptidase
MIKNYIQRLKSFKIKYVLLVILVLFILSFLLIRHMVFKSTLRFEGVAIKNISEKVIIFSSKRSDSIDVENFKDIPQQLLNIPAEFEGIETDNGLKITNIKPKYYNELTENIELLPEDKYQKLYSFLNNMEIKKSENDIMKNILNNGDKIINEINKNYAIASLDENRNLETDRLIEIYRIIVKQQELYAGKAFYINTDNYIPDVYQEIYNNSKGSAAIFRRTDDKPLCSGVLIARDKILTCLHCITHIIYLNDLVAKFGYEENVNGSIYNLDEYPVIEKVAEGSSYNNLNQKLDFVILKLGPNKDNKSAGDKWPIQALAANRTVQLHDAVYVIGYPNGERKKIHDNSYVFWPFEINEKTYKELELFIRAEFEDKKQQNTALREFSISYKKSTLPSGDIIYQNYSIMWNNMPTIGVNCNTSHGNSGSPLYLKRKNGVVGILFNGSKDEDFSYRPGWRYHEAILPIKEIIRQLDQQNPDWRNWPGIEIR